MSLYLKYRPQDFKSVVGQEAVVTTLQNAIRRDSLSHAYLFSGPRGTGKTSLARIIAKAVNCLTLEKSGDPCNRCELCQEINQGKLVDLIEIDAASNRGIDEIRELRDKILFAPTRGRAKIYIIDEVHMLTKEAFNALLKTLEEPPQHAYFILATTEAHKIPETIISRCQQFILHRINAEDIKTRLSMIATTEGIQADAEALSLIAKMANGGLRDAIGFLEQMTLDGKLDYEKVAENLGLSDTLLIESFFQALERQDAKKGLDLVHQIHHQGNNLHQFTSEILSILREKMLIHIDRHEALELILKWVDIFMEAKNQINQSIIPLLPLEMAVIKACFLLKEPSKPETKKEEKKKEPESKKEVKKEPVKEDLQKEGALSELTLEEVKADWQKITEKIETPFIRLSLMDGEPVRLEKGELHLLFKSSSLMEKVANATNQAQIQKAFESIFSRKFKLKLELKKINLKPVTEEASKKTRVADMAREVFGS